MASCHKCVYYVHVLYFKLTLRYINTTSAKKYELKTKSLVQINIFIVSTLT